MREQYTITKARERLNRNGCRFEGKRILGRQPGIKLWGAVDYLKKQGYMPYFEIPKSIKMNVVKAPKF